MSGTAVTAVQLSGRSASHLIYCSLIQRAHDPARRAQNQRSIWNGLALGDQSAGTNQTVLSNNGTIHNGRTHANQRIIADCTTMDDGLVPDSAMSTHGQRIAHIRVHQGQILNIAAFTDKDFFVVTT